MGEYVLREPIGQGGGGIVYKGQQLKLGRELVIKVMRERKHESSNAKERFLREAQLASKLRHPYATHIYSFGV
ncbi:MAG TPA: protein kinase, partial [Kofleriaceae bacterium]